MSELEHKVSLRLMNGVIDGDICLALSHVISCTYLSAITEELCKNRNSSLAN